ncbi:NAD(P)-binding protein [Zopfia rhizophila CBS 207.26]|uniref:NAD(P)-binding protein n=1 Tax=Zopfia rhizophila CBS 207.26 TaxID=1314779 RepID=A0A6A6E5W6_9PEZI|nr:NAD(P)-binding protein [Zopfia rhizophila CBS 207.26]
MPYPAAYEKKTILVLGATGTQGGSVAKLLLQYPGQYIVRCLTRNPSSDKAKALSALGAKGAWGVFAVTDFYDTVLSSSLAHQDTPTDMVLQAVLDDPKSEEKQGKHSVDSVIRKAGLKGCFIRTGNFYENMILRKYAAYDKETDVITMRRPIMGPDAEITTLYVEKDLAAICKAVFDLWETKKSDFDGKDLLASGACETQRDINEVTERVSGKKVVFTTLLTTGIPDRDIMLQLYNSVGMYPGVKVPTPEVLKLGVKLHSAEDYIREKLLPHLGIEPQN